MPQSITPASTAAAEDDCTVSSTGLELYWAVAGTGGQKTLFTASRAPGSAMFGTAIQLPISGADSDETPRLSDDDLTLYFASDRAGGKGGLDVWTSTRMAVGQPWKTPTPLTEVNTTAGEKWFMPCGTNHYMIVVNTGATNGNDLFEGDLGGGAPAPATPLNSTSSETGTFLTKDCKTIFFASTRSGKSLLYTAHRDDMADPWPSPSPVTDFDMGGDQQQDPWISVDQRTFVFASDKSGNYDIYMSTR